MEFENQYLTYDEYCELDDEADIDETPFNLLEFNARKQIDLRTQNRLKNIDSEEIPMEVKICDYNLIKLVSKYANTLEKTAGNVASENTDGYSISYVTAGQIQEIIKSKNAEIDDIIMTNLYGVIVNGEHVIYNGAIGLE